MVNEMTEDFEITKQALKVTEDPIARADLLRNFVKDVYDFVKKNRPEGEGLDGKDGPERRSLGKILDEAEDHYYRMIHIYNPDMPEELKIQALQEVDRNENDEEGLISTTELLKKLQRND